MEEDHQVREHLNQVDMHKCMAPDGTDPCVPLVIVNLLLITFESSWLLGAVPENWRKRK